MMGTLIGSIFSSDIRDIFADVDAVSFPREAQVLRDINSAYIDDLCSVLDLDELDSSTSENTVAATATTTFDGSSHDILIAKTITDPDGTPLTEIKARDYDRFAARSGTITGTPTHWYRTTNATVGDLVVRWYPLPDAVVAMTLSYRKRPSALTFTTATVIDALYDQVILYLAAGRVAARMRNFEEAKRLTGYGIALRDQIAAGQTRSSQHRWGAYGPSLTGAMK